MLPLRIILVSLERTQKRHEFVVGLEPVDLGTRGSQFCQCSFLAGKIRFDIDMGSLDALVAQPQCDHADINAGLKQMRTRRVPHRVWVDPFGTERWTRSVGGSSLQNIIDAIAR